MTNGMLRHRLDDFVEKYVLSYEVVCNFNTRRNICSLWSFHYLQNMGR